MKKVLVAQMNLLQLQVEFVMNKSFEVYEHQAQEKCIIKCIKKIGHVIL